MSPTFRIKRYAAHDVRTGKQLGVPWFSEKAAEKDAKRIGRKHKGEVVALPVEGT